MAFPRTGAPRHRQIVIPPMIHGIHSYGPMHLGIVVPVTGRRSFNATVWGETIGPFPTVIKAQAGALEFWREHCSKESLFRRFSARTRGGLPVSFLHQTGRLENGHIVASVKDASGRWASTSFRLDGTCVMSDQTDWDLVPL